MLYSIERTVNITTAARTSNPTKCKHDEKAK
jgi:hypothetical protein